MPSKITFISIHINETTAVVTAIVKVDNIFGQVLKFFLFSFSDCP